MKLPFLKNSKPIDTSRLALIENSSSYTYAEIEVLSDAYAAAFIEAQIEVAPILLTRSAESCLLYLGALKACKKVVPIGLPLLLQNDVKLAPLIKKKGLFITSSIQTQLLNRIKKFEPVIKTIKPSHTKAILKEEQYSDNVEIVLHTSSTTTLETKAVVISPYYLPKFFNWCKNSFKLNENDTFLLVSPFHFDMNFFDFFLPLYLGATLVLPPNEELWFSDALLDTIENKKITTIHSIPSLWHSTVTKNISPNKIFPFIKRILVAGDILPHYYFHKLKEIFSNVEIYNFYGQTEANSYLFHSLESHRDIQFPILLGTIETYTDLWVDTGNGLKKEGSGTLIADGDNVALGYTSDYETYLPFSKSHKQFSTGDQVEIKNKSVFYHGRMGLELRTRVNQIQGVVQSVVVQTPKGPVLFFEPENKAQIESLKKIIFEITENKIPVYAKGFFPLNYNGKTDTKALLLRIE